MFTPADPTDAFLDTFPLTGDRLEACGISWDGHDIARFLWLCTFNPDTGCLIWDGAKSRGRGNTAWYGTFTTGLGRDSRSVRAHKFYGVAVLGLRPETGKHHLDHTCPNPLCVSHVQCVPEFINLKLRWIRVQVGLDPDKVRDAVVSYLGETVEDWVDDYVPADFAHWITNNNRWQFDQWYNRGNVAPRKEDPDYGPSNWNHRASGCSEPPTFGA